MKRITLSCAANGTYYVPAPSIGVVTGVKAVWQSTVTTSNLVTVSRSSTTVNLVTAVTTAGMVVETGVRDTTNKDLVFDPASTTTTSQVIKVVLSGGNAVAAVVVIEFDEYATVAQAPLEA
jgi:hypothetical protein